MAQLHNPHSFLWDDYWYYASMDASNRQSPRCDASNVTRSDTDLARKSSLWGQQIDPLECDLWSSVAISSLTENPWPQFPMVRKYLSKDTCSAWLVGIPSFSIYYRNSILIITGSLVISLCLVGYTIGIPIITVWLSNRNIPIHYPIIEISLVIITGWLYNRNSITDWWWSSIHWIRHIEPWALDRVASSQHICQRAMFHSQIPSESELLTLRLTTSWKLVGGWATLLINIYISQIGSSSQLLGKIKTMFQTTNQKVDVFPAVAAKGSTEPIRPGFCGSDVKSKCAKDSADEEESVCDLKGSTDDPSLGKWQANDIFNGLVYGTIYRKTPYLMRTSMVSCRFSLKPIHWYWGYALTMKWFHAVVHISLAWCKHCRNKCWLPNDSMQWSSDLGMVEIPVISWRGLVYCWVHYIYQQ